MIIVLILYVLCAIMAARLLWRMIRTSAGFMVLATKGIRHSMWGPIPIVQFAITPERRIRNAIAAVLFPVGFTAVILLAMIWLASLIAMAV